MLHFNSIFGLLIAVSLMAVCADSANAGPPVYVGQRAAGRIPFEQINHAPWDALLEKYVDRDGYMNYHVLHASAADRRTLDGYLTTLSQANLQAKTSKDATLAFWINAYNAVTVHGILREYPTTSIRNHTAKLVGYNIWKDLQLLVGGRPYSLEAIEHQVLRKMGEPRIHFAIVCASIGCPRLLNQAYTAADVQRQLETNARDFFSRPQNFQFDMRTGQFQLSEILNWFGEDFGPDQPAQLRTIAKWLPNQAAQAAAQRGAGRVSFIPYNWDLNDQRSRRGVARE
ncbi:DUF547 domain-containing protein [Fuerstiella marisgermanici]|uniref:DUF547 domain-containing protein n=1 Tax=Fuerstiella marisgermanici TaxID=1891926 RepID=A0A1P8WFN8_9PLAN|nr:DUF547 domain-containing protein [Fuerstiella marisgermanici]APZ92874.1 hypothetical protein Fuma_02486 [Fuerstiella marisgermanici]